jgi:hypothetical protein
MNIEDDRAYNAALSSRYGDDIVDAYEREDRRREKDARLQRETRRMNQNTTNKKRGKALRKKGS